MGNNTMPKIDVYTKPWCRYSGYAINMLNRRGLPYNEINITADPSRENEMKNRSGRETVPQIFFGHVHIGGSDDLLLADKSGMLDRLVEKLRNNTPGK